MTMTYTFFRPISGQIGVNTGKGGIEICVRNSTLGSSSVHRKREMAGGEGILGKRLWHTVPAEDTK